MSDPLSAIHPPDDPGPTDLAAPAVSFLATGLSAMRKHFRRMLGNEPATIAGEAEALHDMRVASRRLRAAFRIFRDAFEPGTFVAFNEEARWVARLLGTVRDLDVFLQWLGEYKAALPADRQEAASRLIANRAARREVERAALVAGLESERYRAFVREFANFLDTAPFTPPVGTPEPASALTDAVPADGPAPEPAHAAGATPAGTDELTATAALRRQLKRVRKFPRKLRFADQDRMHELRIACKRLRYAAEFFRDKFPDRSKALIESCVALQDALGAMRDAHVQAEWLREPIREHHREVRLRMALLQIARVLRRRQRDQYREFRRLWKIFTAKKSQRKIKRDLSGGEGAMKDEGGETVMRSA